MNNNGIFSEETRQPGEQSLTIPVHEEQLQVGKRVVDTGRGVRVHKAVVETAQEIDEPLLHDEISVEHIPVDRIVALDAAPAARQDGDTFIVPVVEEVLVVEKRLRIKEELHITRRKREERHPQTVTLRAEKVSVERFDESKGEVDPGEAR